MVVVPCVRQSTYLLCCVITRQSGDGQEERLTRDDSALSLYLVGYVIGFSGSSEAIFNCVVAEHQTPKLKVQHGGTREEDLRVDGRGNRGEISGRGW